MISILHKGKNYKICKRDFKPDSVPDWEYEGFAFLCKELIKNNKARELFLNFYIKENPPLLLSDPDKPFNSKLVFPRSAFFDKETIVLFKKDDPPEKLKLKELITKLIKNDYLKKDKLSIIRCSDCGEFSVGSGDTDKKKSFHCTRCGKPAHKKKSPSKKVISVYAFSPELKDLLFRWRGRILEGIVYHQCCLDAEINKSFKVIAYPQIQSIKKDSKGQETEIEGSEERDIVLIAKQKKIPPIVILAGISSSQRSEKKQVEKCSDLGLPVIFVCARGVSVLSTITSKSIKIFDSVTSDEQFPVSLTNYIIKELLPYLESA